MTSYAVINLEENDLIRLNPYKKTKNSVISIVGVGSGIGTSIAYPIKTNENTY